MKNIRFHQPTSIAEAASVLGNRPGARLLAGGTDFLVKWRNGLWPDLTDIVDLNRLQLREISVKADGKIIVGSCCTMSQVAAHPEIRKRFPALVQGASLVGAPQIRNAATLGGNVANASPAGDSVPALISIGAEAILRAPRSIRQVPVSEIATGPGKTMFEPGELIEAFVLPNLLTRGAFLKLGERLAHAISKINVAVSLWEAGGSKHARLAFGSVAPTIIRVPEAENLLAESDWPPPAAILEKIAAVACATVKPIDDIRSDKAYRQKMAGVLAERVIQKAFQAW